MSGQPYVNQPLYVKAYFQQVQCSKALALSLVKGVSAFSDRFGEKLMDTLTQIGDSEGRLSVSGREANL
ncbi:hypothetical protein CISECK367B_22275 [Citrobacter sedlakii]|uniref:hypothetical protein n=1 Tax=Citrobacter sedlakii TaxID=67826 RepID=UPI003B24599F